MRELERRLESWRAGLRGPAAAPEVVEELEGHLREEFQRLLGQGLPEERAWEQALARLGSPEALAGEFAKVPAAPVSWLPVWLAAGVGVVLALALLLLLGMRFQSGRMGTLLVVHVGSVTLGYSATFLAGFLAVCYVAQRTVGGLSAGQEVFLSRVLFQLHGLALVLTALGVLLGGVWAQEHLGRFWGWDAKETGGLAVLVYNAVLTLFWWRRPAREQVGILLGLVGNVTVCLAWFGPLLLGAGGSSYGAAGSPLFWALEGFVLVQVVLFALGLAPRGWVRRLAG